MLDEFDLDDEDQRRLIAAIDRRRRRIDGTAFIAALATFVLWLGVSVPAVAWLHDGLHLSPIRVVLYYVLTLGLALVVAIVVSQRVRHSLLRHQIAHHLDTPLCFWCGHNLTGVPHQRRIVVCPEWGEHHP